MILSTSTFTLINLVAWGRIYRFACIRACGCLSRCKGKEINTMGDDNAHVCGRLAHRLVHTCTTLVL